MAFCQKYALPLSPPQYPYPIQQAGLFAPVDLIADSDIAIEIVGNTDAINLEPFVEDVRSTRHPNLSSDRRLHDENPGFTL